ncbi:hypothetical protein [Aureimonas endophytica]|nr:hypothetical protein [Aureimonas endophytica]
MENRDRLSALATAAYGSRWQTEAANALGVSDRSVRAWVSGRTPVSDGVVRDLRGIVAERIGLLREALASTALEPPVETTPVLLDLGGDRPVTRIVGVSGIRRSDGTDGDLLTATVRVEDPESGEFVELEFGEQVADGVFVTLNSYHQSFHREDWIEAIAPAHPCAADIVFEAAKGLVREHRPDLTGQAEEGAVREALEAAGWRIVRRDPAQHYHWLLVHDGHGIHQWEPSLRSAARELLPDED